MSSGNRIKTLGKKQWTSRKISRHSSMDVDLKSKCDQQISTITGIVRITDKQRSVWVRGFWLFLMVSCACLSLELAHERIKYYYSEPILANTEAKTNTSMTFPVITVCRRGRVGEIYNNHTIQQFQANIIKCVIERDKNCSQVGEWRSVLTVLGICFSFQLAYDVNMSGPYHGLYIKLNNFYGGIKLLVHDRIDTPQIEAELNGVSVFRSNFVDFIITYKQFLRKNKKGFACDENSNYSFSHCIAQCWNDHISAVARCNLPRLDVAASAVESDNCSVFDRDRVKDAIKHEMELGQWKPSNCNRCVRPCKSNSFDVRNQVHEMHEMSTNNNNRTTVIRIYYDDMTYEALHESRAYSLMALACDIGGSFGFCLGISIPTIVELVEMMTVAINKKITNVKCKIIN